MDDYSVSSLQESRNEWCSRLINILTPLVIEGFKSIYEESWKLCLENDETDKYLMTFQNFLARIPKWNATIVEQETSRIVEKSNCGYLNDLISCVHVIQLKSLTCMRVGNKQKKIDINIPELNEFIHKVYINSARKIYTNIYLFEKNITPLQIQKHNRELELIVKEQILNSIRDNIPVENILKVYLDETIEEDIQVEENEEIISTEPIIEENNEENPDDNENDNKEGLNDEDPIGNNEKSNTIEEIIKQSTITNDNEKLQIEPSIEDDVTETTKHGKGIKFNDIDSAISIDNKLENINAPKTDERLDQISIDRHIVRKQEEDADDDEDDDRIKIGEKVSLNDIDVHNLEESKQLSPISLDEIEILT